MLDFFPKLVIIKHRIIPCEEYQASDVFNRAGFITMFNLCEDLEYLRGRCSSMSSRPLQYRKPPFKETTQEPTCRKYPDPWRWVAKEKGRILVVPAPAVLLCIVTFLGAGGRFGQA
jgi:hypothetical protein